MGPVVTPIRLVVADDEPLVRQGLLLVLAIDEDLVTVGEAGDGEEALALVREHRPDLALLDIRMPGLDGVEVVRRIRADPALRSTRALLLTTFAEDSLLVAAVRAGASGYLLKSMAPEHIRHSVRLAASDQTALAPDLVDRLLREHVDSHRTRSPVLDRLTERESDVLRQVAAGRSNAEIAAGLYLGEGTVKTHVAAILRKLDVRDRTQAAIAAYELGLISPNAPDRA